MDFYFVRYFHMEKNRTVRRNWDTLFSAEKDESQDFCGLLMSTDADYAGAVQSGRPSESLKKTKIGFSLLV